jgi:hypothetical protein
MTDINEFPKSSISENSSIPEGYKLNEEVSIPMERVEDKPSIEDSPPPKNINVRPESKSVYVSNETHRIFKAPLSQQILRLLVKRTGSKFNHFDFNSNVKDEFQKKLIKRVKQIVPSCTVIFDKKPDMIVQDENGDRLCGVQWIYFNREDQCDPKKWYVDLVFMKYSNDTYYTDLLQSITSFFEHLEQANHNRNVNGMNNRNRNRNTNKRMNNSNTMNNGNTMNNRIGGGKRKKTQKKRRIHRRS